jgi:alkanesulfonate monooxygenase SsuD/methylene tetrahydromethanopterin reductase-like flavin-dependent oxidoreductase (luciferase family)
MRLGIHMPLKDQDGVVLTAEGVMARAKAIEDAGLDGIWIGDGIGAMARPDPLMWLLVAAAGTKDVEVGTCVLQVPLRNPVELAQRFITLQALTRGRFAIGVGSGSGRRSFDALGSGDDFDHRFRTLRDNLKLIRQLCNGEVVGEANLHPWPEVMGGPPIIIGAWHSERWMRRAAEEYDGWMCSGSFGHSKAKGDETTFISLEENLKHFRDMGGKRALISSVMVDLAQPNTHLADAEPFNLRCGPEAAAERLARLDEIGYDDILLVKRDSTKALSLYEDDVTVEELATIRGLLKKDERTTVGA